MKSLLVLISVSTMAVAFPPSALGQLCGAIASCGTEEGSDHLFVEVEPFFRNENPGNPGYHGSCETCVDWTGEPVSAFFCHFPCPPGAVQSQTAFRHLIEEARSGNVKRLLAAAQRVPEGATINEVRRSLQILDCQGRVVANIPLGDAYAKAVNALVKRGTAIVGRSEPLLLSGLSDSDVPDASSGDGLIR